MTHDHRTMISGPRDCHCPADPAALAADIVAAAELWRDRIHDDPRQWADDEDFALIDAVDAWRAAKETTTP